MQTNVNTPPKPFSMGNQPRTVYSGGHDHTIKVAENQARCAAKREYDQGLIVRNEDGTVTHHNTESVRVAQPIQSQQAE